MKGEDFQKLLQERKDSFEVEEKGGVLRRCEKVVDEKRPLNGGESTASQARQTAPST